MRIQKTDSESYKRLIRNLRKKKDEKYSISKNNAALLPREKSKDNKS